MVAVWLSNTMSDGFESILSKDFPAKALIVAFRAPALFLSAYEKPLVSAEVADASKPPTLPMPE